MIGVLVGEIRDYDERVRYRERRVEERESIGRSISNLHGAEGRCSACNQPVTSLEECTVARGKLWHTRHLCCVDCGRNALPPQRPQHAASPIELARGCAPAGSLRASRCVKPGGRSFVSNITFRGCVEGAPSARSRSLVSAISSTPGAIQHAPSMRHALGARAFSIVAGFVRDAAPRVPW